MKNVDYENHRENMLFYRDLMFYNLLLILNFIARFYVTEIIFKSILSAVLIILIIIHLIKYKKNRHVRGKKIT